MTSCGHLILFQKQHLFCLAERACCHRAIINYKLAKNSFVTLDVYDMLGKHVAKLVNAYQSSGNYNQKFAAENLSGGVYFYTLKVDGFISSKKMILIK